MGYNSLVQLSTMCPSRKSVLSIHYQKTYFLFWQRRLLLSNRFWCFRRAMSVMSGKFYDNDAFHSVDLNILNLIFNTDYGRQNSLPDTCSHGKVCSYGAIATTIYLLQLIGCMGFIWCHCHNQTIWTFTLNSYDPLVVIKKSQSQSHRVNRPWYRSSAFI